MARSSAGFRRLSALFSIFVGFGVALANQLDFTEQIGTEVFGELREVERYQLKVAEKFYLQGEHAVALDEYEKYLNLYPDGKGAPYAQLMWSHCQRHLRHVNTAIREGYQSVKDYWPDSEEAVLAEFMIGKSLKEIGEVAEAATVFAAVAEAYPEHRVAFLAQMERLDLARLAGDQEERVRILEGLTFKLVRTEGTKVQCVEASRELAAIRITAGDVDGGREALATTYQDDDLARQVYEVAKEPIRQLHHNEETRAKSIALADQLIRQQETAMEGGENTRELLFRVAGLYGVSGRGDKVLENYEKIAKSVGMDDRLRGAYAGFYQSRNELDQALGWYLKYEDAVSGHRAAGELCRNVGKFDRGLEIYEALIPMDGDRASEYHWAIAECYDRLEEHEKAITSYRLADNFPHNYFRMASSHRRMEQWGEALALYGQCKADVGSQPEAMLQIALTLEESGKREEAIAGLQATCRAHPKSSQASRAHAHLQDKYGISITLGGAKDE